MSKVNEQASLDPSREQSLLNQHVETMPLADDVRGDIWPYPFHDNSQGMSVADYDTTSTLFNDHTTSSTYNPIDNQLSEENSTTISPEFALGATLGTSDVLDDERLYTTAADDDLYQSSFDSQTTTFDFSEVLTPVRSSKFATASPLNRSPKPCSNIRTSPESTSFPGSLSPSLSPAIAAYTTNTNRGLICENLLTIYHDVLENNLGCWLAESTCPFQMSKPQQALVSASQCSFEPSPVLEWGTAWSNRMYRRVKNLDRVAQAIKITRLTREENLAASKSLDMVIMAFATQWSQASKPRDDDSENDGRRFGLNFEQTLRQSVWQQARRALEEVADLECFRVVYAELIFGLIQGPSAVDRYEEVWEEPLDNPGTTSIYAQITEILSRGGPPVFSERGARKMHALKHRFHTQDVKLRRHGDIIDVSNPPLVGTEERRTIGLLYWLAVMFDTVSSSIYERPFVLSDDECEHDGASAYVLSSRWELDLYAQENSQKPSPLRWPCSYQEATRAVARSAAVKVLLFRYVGYLQNAVRKTQSSQGIEEIITAAISVYRYWNQTHGAFFRDLTRNYNNVPARIKSWFPCISIPWHLGSFMLADLLDLVDEGQLGFHDERIRRCAMSLATTIRSSSATELADFAAVGAFDELQSMNPGQMLGFHFAVEKSPLLIEPWTVLLIRAFTKASLVHLAQAGDIRDQDWILGHSTEDIQVIIQRGKCCINALKLLGTKSDMAHKLWRVFSWQLSAFDGKDDRGCI